MSKFIENKFFVFLLLFIFIIHQYIFQSFFPNSKGLLGHDYEYFVPSFIFGKIWFLNNFLSVPWFTPSFCCGIPFFADPQSMYYSIQQIIFLIFDPILSLKIFFLILSGFSYVGMFLLAKKNFKFNNYVSLLCASLFLFNGFFVYRAIAGHVAYLSYIFVPLYCFFLISSTQNKSNYIYLVLSSIVFAYLFHSGSGAIILIIFISILTVLLLYSHLENSLKVFFKFFQSLTLGVLISLSKITASLFFLNNFPRQYPTTEFNSLASFIKTFFLSLFFKPNHKDFNESITSMFPFGVHEMEYSVSVVPIILIFFIFYMDTKFLRLNYYNIRFIVLLFIIFFIPILLNVNFLNQFQIIAKIPILSSTWVQFRWMAIYILPIIIISGLLVENFKIDLKQKKYLVIVSVLVLLAQNLVKDNSWHLEDQRYNMKNAMDFSTKVRKGINPEIIGPAILLDKSDSPLKMNNRNDMFFYSYSPLLCYQPIFGYGLEKLNAQQITFSSKKLVQDGSGSSMYYSNKLDKKDGHFMFFNPSCFLYPKANNCLPGDTFKISEKEKLIQFTNYQKFEFKQNKIQTFSNYVSFFTFLASLLYLLYHLIIFIYGSKKEY